MIKVTLFLIVSAGIILEVFEVKWIWILNVTRGIMWNLVLMIIKGDLQ